MGADRKAIAAVILTALLSAAVPAATPETDLVPPPGWEPLIQAGRTARNSGDHEQARTLFAQAVEVAEQAEPRGYHHAIALRELGQALLGLERFEQALETHRRALTLLEARYSPEDILIVGSLYGMADAHLGLGDAAAAEPLIRRGLAIQSATFGEESIAVAHARIRLADLLAGQERPREARELYQAAVAYFEARSAQGPALEPLRAALEGLGDVYLALGETELARQALTRAAVLAEQARDPSDAIERINHALELIDRGDYAPAREILLEGLVDLRKILPERHVHIGLVHYNLGIAEGGLGEWAAAAASYASALKIFDAVHPPDHIDRIRCLEAYERVLRALHRDDEAAEIARKLRDARGS